MNAIIIDDEEFAITALQSDIEFYCKDVKVIATCRSSKEGMQAIKASLPDLVFLDIDMPWMNGMEMLELLADSVKFNVIFTTAHSQHAAKAFRLSAIDYLLKPIDKDELIDAVRKASLSIKAGQQDRIGNLLHNYKQPATEQKIALPEREGFEFVKVKDISYCKADGAYTNIVLANKRAMLISKPLGEVETMLPEEMFERIHHSTIININYVKNFVRKEGASVVMESGDDLAISRSKKERVMWVFC